MIPGRRHERLAQHHLGVPVFGGELARQSDAAGTLTRVRHALRGDRRRDRAAPARRRRGGADRGARRTALRRARAGPSSWCCRSSGGYRLAWRVRAFFERTFERAPGVPGRRQRRDPARVRRPAEAGRPRSAPASSGTRRSSASRPARAAPTRRPTACGRRSISTYDFRFNVNRFILFLNANDPLANLTAADLGHDTDNVWTDGALVDAHVYAGLHVRLLLHPPRAARARQRRHPGPLDHARAAARGLDASTPPTRSTPSSRTPSTSATASCTTATACRRRWSSSAST